MKINFSTPLKTLDGVAMKLSDASDEMATIARVCVDALMDGTDSKEINGDEKLKRYQLAMRLRDGGEVDVSLEEAVLLKQLTGKLYSPLVVGQVWPVLGR